MFLVHVLGGSRFQLGGASWEAWEANRHGWLHVRLPDGGMRQELMEPWHFRALLLQGCWWWCLGVGREHDDDESLCIVSMPLDQSRSEEIVVEAQGKYKSF